MELLDISLVEIELRDGTRDLGVGENTELLTTRDEAFDLFEFLQFRY